jgi:hypothetical protein
MRGAFGGEMSPGNLNNRKGMFENIKIRNDIVKPYFRSLDVDPMGQFPLPELPTKLIPVGWDKKIEEIIKAEGYEGGPWMYKGAKLCLHWDVWDYAFPSAKWIIVRRKSSDIINSCLRTGFMRGFRNRTNQNFVGAKDEWDGWLWWIHQHEARFVEMIQAGLNCKVIWPERMVDGDYSQIKEMLEWLGLEWGPEVTEFIEPKLWKSRQIQKQK